MDEPHRRHRRRHRTRDRRSAARRCRNWRWHGYERVVYLGSGLFQGLAREAALKLGELTNGAVATCFDSPLGFRHGPKTFITDSTLVMVFVSNDPLTRRYDLDLIDELRRDGCAARIIEVTAQPRAAAGADTHRRCPAWPTPPTSTCCGPTSPSRRSTPSTPRARWACRPTTPTRQARSIASSRACDLYALDA